MEQSPLDSPAKAAAEHQGASAPFYIAATASFQEAWPRTLKHGDTFAMFDAHGDILNAAGNPAGIFHQDTRYLSGSYLLIEGHRPLLLSSRVHDDNALLTVDLANPDIVRGDEIVMSRETLHFVRTKFLWEGSCYERIAAENFDRRAHETRLLLWFAADFADLFEVRGMHRSGRGGCHGERIGSDQAMFQYRGLDGVDRYTHLQFWPPPSMLDHHHAAFDLNLAAGERWSAVVISRFRNSARIGGPRFVPALRAARRQSRFRAREAAAISTSNAVFNKVFCRSVSDLNMLITETPEGLYPYAGIPWFSTAFGRDGIITAMQMLWLNPDVAKGVLRFLAAHQATGYDELSEAEPGKILHEIRQGEMAELGEVPFKHYYGSVDSTPLFVMLAGRYFDRTGDKSTIAHLWPHIETALNWIDNCGDPDGDGFIEYRQRTDKGLNNQGWKDSKDCIMHADGRLAEGAIALVEVQAYVFAAKRHAAKLARQLGRKEHAEALERQADSLRKRFEQAFWCEDLGTYALALDGEKHPCRVKSSNAGHALFAGIASPARARRVATGLMRREAFSGWGIRTLNEGEKRYNPMSYHNGSVWPHDNAIIAQGFARYGLKEEVLRIFSGLFEAVQHMDMRLPELFCGFRQRPSSGPTLYPVACAPQAWASGAPLMLLAASLGLTIDCARNEIRFERPLLPPVIDDIAIRNLRIGHCTADLSLQRHGRDVVVDVLKRAGDLRVVTIS
ncbi:MAG: amylo-alpha-1,6-glucosidase [Alphaproteobacteria bacterium]|nr:amylo-alpha-1,6-glucosidase [Alphaproteobacteria bacterium]